MSTKYAGFEPIPQPTLVATFGKWITKITRPSDGDYITGASVYVAIDGLTDRTNWLAWRTIDIRGGGAYTTAPVTINGFWTFQGETDFYDLRCTASSWPKLEPARTVYRASWRLDATTYTGSLDLDTYVPDARVIIQPGDITGVPVLKTLGNTDSTAGTRPRSIIEIEDLPAGATLTNIKVKFQGIGAGGDGTGSFEIIRWKAGSIDSLSSVTLDSHNGGNWTSYITQTITPTGTVTIDTSYRYGIRVLHPYDAGAASFRINEVVAQLSAGSIRL